MLKTAWISQLTKAVSLLLEHGEAEAAKALNNVLAEDAAHRAAISEAQSTRQRKPGTGAPTKRYRVELEPGWTMHVDGAKAAAQAVADTLKELGSKRTPPKATSMGVALSRQGQWFALIDTDNGTVSLTVSRADD